MLREARSQKFAPTSDRGIGSHTPSVWHRNCGFRPGLHVARPSSHSCSLSRPKPRWLYQPIIGPDGVISPLGTKPPLISHGVSKKTPRCPGWIVAQHFRPHPRQITNIVRSVDCVTDRRPVRGDRTIKKIDVLAPAVVLKFDRSP
jgi:hypothetical protein